jgi:predicted component of type VI protein secretion system
LLPRSPTAFRVEVSVDPSLDTEPDPDRPCPPPRPPISCTLDLPESPVGRADAVPPPVLPLDDPGVSRRHAAFLVEHGALWILDLGSTNGTQVNGVSLQPQVRTALQVGDQVTLGRWTRIEVK